MKSRGENRFLQFNTTVLTSPHFDTLSIKSLRPVDKSMIALLTALELRSCFKSSSFTSVQPKERTANLIG
uniref:Uncharacterized protein n=1 Tax=Romanomermis culicivorax TaxID=13658 RepID=A0A915KE52_ROMCU